MRQITLILTLFLAFGTYGQIKNNEIESILNDCLVQSYKEQQVNIMEELNKLEKYLISSNSLKSSSGQSYFDFYMEIAELNDIPATLDYDRFENIYKLTPNEFYSTNCLEQLKQLDSSTIAKSKYSQMAIAIQNAAQNEVSPSSISKAITSVLKPSDFKKQYYRAVALLTIAYTANSDVEAQTQTKSGKNKANEGFKAVMIKITDEDRIIADNREMSPEELKKFLINFIRENKSKHLIKCKSDPQTSYRFYIAVQDQIGSAYEEVRNEIAKTKYKLPFSNLTVTQKSEIKNIYPRKVEE